jgi:hypothetical protein
MPVQDPIHFVDCAAVIVCDPAHNAVNDPVLVLLVHDASERALNTERAPDDLWLN